MAKQLKLARQGEEFRRHLTTLFSLPAETLQVVAGALNTTDGFDTTSETFPQIVAEHEELRGEVLQDALKVAEFLFRRITAKTLPLDAALAEIAKYCKANEIPDYESKLEAVGSLIGPKDEFRILNRRRTHEHGILPSLKSVSAVRDARFIPSYDEISPSYLVPMLLMKLTLEDDDEESIVNFQMTVEELGEFHDAVGEYVEELGELTDYLDGLGAYKRQAKDNGDEQ